jgi:hypothetical protein
MPEARHRWMMYPPPSTEIGGAAATPRLSTSTPARSEHQRRAHPSATKLAIVAPVVSTPPHSTGRPNSSFSQSIEICSNRPANGDETQAPGFWSSALARQSAPRAAGVVPVHEVEERPGRVHRAVDGADELLHRALGPHSSSGSGPPKVSAMSSARGSRTGRSAMPFR